MPFTITIENTGETFEATGEQTVLDAMEGKGRQGIDVGCRFGGCGVCKIEILRDTFRVAKPMSRAHVTEEDERAGRVLACRVAAASDLVVRRFEIKKQGLKKAS